MTILHSQNLVLNTDVHPRFTAKPVSRTGSFSILMTILHSQNLNFLAFEKLTSGTPASTHHSTLPHQRPESPLVVSILAGYSLVRKSF